MQGCGRALSLPLSLTGEEGVCGRALCLQECAHRLHWSERERERERERKREKERERERKRERCRICPELLFLFLKGMTGAMAPFSYLVFYINY